MPDTDIAGDWTVGVFLNTDLVTQQNVHVLCPKGTYENLDAKCEACASLYSTQWLAWGSQGTGVICGSAGNTLQNLTLEDGWWRESPDSAIVLPCKQRAVCVKGECADGHEGPLCGVCESQWFYSAVTGTCQECSRTHTMVACLVIGLMVFMAALLGIAEYRARSRIRHLRNFWSRLLVKTSTKIKLALSAQQVRCGTLLKAT